MIVSGNVELPPELVAIPPTRVKRMIIALLKNLYAEINIRNSNQH